MGELQEPLRLLVVENDVLVAVQIKLVAADLGWKVIGPAATLGEANYFALASKIDGAILDITLEEGELSFPVAMILQDRGVPFLFASANALPEFRPGFEAVPALQKPFSSDQLVTAVREHILITQNRWGRNRELNEVH